MSSSPRLQARPERSNKVFLLRDHLQNVQQNGNNILGETIRNSRISPEEVLVNEDIRTRILKIICACHDIGKASRFFQIYISPGGKNTGIKKAHSPLSALYGFFASRRLFSDLPKVDIVSTIVSMCVVAHHGHLESPTKSALLLRSMGSTIYEQIDSIDRVHLSELDQICKSFGLPPFSEFKEQAKKTLSEFVALQGKLNYEQEDLRQFYYVSDLFSSLIDADRLDAAELELPSRNEIHFEDVKINIAAMQESAKHEANRAVVNLREILFRLVAQKAETVSLDNRIFSLTAPTGSGKTLSGLYFALRLKDRLRTLGSNPRIIYVAPFLSVIDQNFEVFKKALGEYAKRSDIILAHHHLCEMNYKDEQREYSTDKSILLVEGWDSEIIVTTLVQFAYTILGRGSKELRKFHNIAGSIVILDEVQAIPDDYWYLFRSALKFMARFYGTTFILMTATQPLIFDKEEILEIAGDLNPESTAEKCILDVSSFKTDDSGASKRKTVDEFAGSIISSLNGKAAKLNVMIVMNTIGSASMLYDKLHNGVRFHDIYYLSAEVTPKERKARIQIIKQLIDRRMKEESKPVLLVTTQLIEAGIDIDFDLVFRDLGPIDSIIQCAGRCNRQGHRPRKDSITSIIELVDDAGKPFARKVYGNTSIQRTKEILSNFKNESFEQLSSHYYDEMKSAREQVTERKILEGIQALCFDKLDDFKLIEERPSGSV
ncbi:MAG: CRISPR-associated helicase Cas3', partial [Nitrososphaerales archaeon]